MLTEEVNKGSRRSKYLPLIIKEQACKKTIRHPPQLVLMDMGGFLLKRIIFWEFMRFLKSGEIMGVLRRLKLRQLQREVLRLQLRTTALVQFVRLKLVKSTNLSSKVGSGQKQFGQREVGY